MLFARERIRLAVLLYRLPTSRQRRVCAVGGAIIVYSSENTEIDTRGKYIYIYNTTCLCMFCVEHSRHPPEPATF